MSDTPPDYRPHSGDTEESAVRRWVEQGGTVSGDGHYTLYRAGVSSAGIRAAAGYEEERKIQALLGLLPSSSSANSGSQENNPYTPSVSGDGGGGGLAVLLIPLAFPAWIAILNAIDYTVDRYHAFTNYVGSKYEETLDRLEYAKSSVLRILTPDDEADSKFVVLSTDASFCPYIKLDFEAVAGRSKNSLATELENLPGRSIHENFFKKIDPSNPKYTERQKRKWKNDAKPKLEGYTLAYSATVTKPDGTILKSAKNADGTITLSGRWRSYDNLPENENPFMIFQRDINPDACDHGTFSYTVASTSVAARQEIVAYPSVINAPRPILPPPAPIFPVDNNKLGFLTVDGTKPSCERTEVPLGNITKSVNLTEVYNALVAKPNASVSKELSLGMAMNGASADQKYDLRFNGGDKHPDGYLKLTGTWLNQNTVKTLTADPTACTSGAFVLKAAIK